METKTDLEQDNLKGRVKRVIGYEIENYDPKRNSPQKISYEDVYNPQGRKIEKIFYEEDGNISSKETWKYDEQGNLLENNRDSYYEGVHSFSLLTCKYDEKGNKIEEIWDSNSSSTKFIWKYNEKEELIEYIRYEDETVSRKRKRIYYEVGERGNRVKTIWYQYELGKAFNVERYYNEHEKLIEAIYYEENGNISSKETWKYDDKGNLIEHIEYNKNGKIDLKRTSKYDDKGNKIEATYYDNQIGKEFFKYNDKGNLIEKIWYNRNGKIRAKKTWKYDDKGNEMERYEGRQDRKKWQEAFSKFTYENNRTTIERVRYTNGNISSEETWKYDEKGKLIEVSERKKQNTGKWKEELTKYEYDDQGNWIQEMIFKQQRNKQIISKRIQEIEYYQDEE